MYRTSAEYQLAISEKLGEGNCFLAFFLFYFMKHIYMFLKHKRVTFI